MALERVRFLHSSNWKLEQPLGGVGDVPSELREEFLQAPFSAAERVVDLAIREQVDFLILTGDLIGLAAASPYALEFLLRQFARLREHQLAVYWLGGALDDPDLWPAQLDLPDNVHTFPAGRIEERVHIRDGEATAVLVGKSHRRGSEFRSVDYVGSGTTPRIALVYGDVSASSLDAQGVRYWALGGRDRYQSVLDGPVVACYTGRPQGRSPQDNQRHGPVLVELKFGECELRHLSSEVWSWRQERIESYQGTELSGLEQAMRDRLRQMARDESARGLLIEWSVNCGETLARTLRDESTKQRLLQSLRTQATTDAKWSLAIDVDPPEIPSDLWEEDSVCGDFLRAVRELQQQPESWQRLEASLPIDSPRELLWQQLQSLTLEQQQELWHYVASLGVDLLRGEATLTATDRGEKP